PAVLHPFPDLPHHVGAITGPHDLHDRHFEVTELAQRPPPPVIHVSTGTTASTRSGWGARGGKRHRGDDFIARSPCLASGGAGGAPRSRAARGLWRSLWARPVAEPLGAACGGGSRAGPAIVNSAVPPKTRAATTRVGERPRQADQLTADRTHACSPG